MAAADLWLHVSEVHRFADPKDPFMRVHVEMGSDSEFWKGEITFMLPDKDMLLSEIEYEAKERVRRCAAVVLQHLDALP